ncbi:DUF2239 family protein [Phenylobacterium sp.]|uniref:DUF2239 family protein n=1 Tax=Phenylobacterium sp. TaxID=1871053 RepID=UPI00286D7107|nr:DUF2239 family protein [Phenylobacterium sp.]
MDEPATYTAFAAQHGLATGALWDVALAAKAAHDSGREPVLVFDDATGRTVELDYRGSPDDVLARLPSSEPRAKPGRGRPRLGVTAREVTLLPRHWEWLASQPGGASAVLRRLVEQALRENSGADDARQALEAAHRAMTTLAGDLPDYEEAMRAFYAKDYARFGGLTAPWPRDVGDYLRRLVAKVEQRQAAA